MTSSAMNTSSRAKRWVSTVFDVQNFNSNLLQNIGNGITYAIIGKETCPTTNREHLQCFFKFNSPIQFSTLQAKLPSGSHIERARGTDFQNFTYCSKENIQEEIGTRPQVNKKRKSETQSEILKKYCKNEMTLEEMAEQDNLFVMRNLTEIRNFKKHLIEDKKEPTELYLIIGERGIGKTTFATKLSRSYYIKTSNMGRWWDGYNQEEVVILDDFNGWMLPDEIFNLCDSKPHMVPIKRDFVKFTSKALVITSRKLPEYWWKPEITKEYDMRRFDRRVTLTWIWTSREERMFFNYKFNNDMARSTQHDDVIL